MKRHASVVLGVFFLQALPLQNPQQPQTATVEGMVVRSGTDEPVAASK